MNLWHTYQKGIDKFVKEDNLHTAGAESDFCVNTMHVLVAIPGSSSIMDGGANLENFITTLKCQYLYMMTSKCNNFLNLSNNTLKVL